MLLLILKADGYMIGCFVKEQHHVSLQLEGHINVNGPVPHAMCQCEFPDVFLGQA